MKLQIVNAMCVTAASVVRHLGNYLPTFSHVHAQALLLRYPYWDPHGRIGSGIRCPVARINIERKSVFAYTVGMTDDRTAQDDDANDSVELEREENTVDDEDSTGGGTASNNYLQELEAKVEELTIQNAKLLDMAARAQADLQNAKARLEKDGDDIRKYASQAVLVKLLPLIDNFQRAFQHLPEELKNHEWVKGVNAIEQDFLKQLSEMGLKKFESLGQVADSSRHEVLMVGEGAEGVVTEVFEEGYELSGKVLRPAKVKVGGGK